jgi:hypothetical protein
MGHGRNDDERNHDQNPFHESEHCDLQSVTALQCDFQQP